ncbi:MAG: SDR family oxidoreductase [Rhodoferax sp.]|nr:SDR family oxidoreductase [Rhodoferax sp.]
MTDKLALVTGGGGGIGAAVCELASQRGYRVVVADQDLGAAQRVADDLPMARAEQLDVTDESAVEAMLDRVGQVPDLLVNNAGIGRFGPLMSMPLGEFSLVVQVNLVACFVVARACARRMQARGSGQIVNITSINSINPGPGAGAYPAAKAGLARLSQQMALEWGPLGLRVNSVAPGFIDAGISTPFYANPVIRELRGNAVPSRRLGQAMDVAQAVLFLASDEASYINGHELVVDGGVTPSLLSQLPREPKKD